VTSHVKVKQTADNWGHFSRYWTFCDPTSQQWTLRSIRCITDQINHWCVPLLPLSFCVL